MPYTKSGIFYTAKPTVSGSVASRMRGQYGGGYKGGPKYQPGYYRTYGSKTTVPRTRGVFSQAGENKYFDTELAKTAIPASADWAGTELDPDTVPVASINTLFAPVKGNGINNRIGRTVKVKKIRFRGYLVADKQANQSASDNAGAVRIMLVQDTQTNATQMSGEDCMQDPTTNSAEISINSFQSLANLGRFKILRDKKFNYQPPQASFDGTNIEQYGQGRLFKWNIKFNKPVLVHFNETNGGTIADIVDNSFHILATCTSTDAAYELAYQTRIVYCE